MREKFFDDQQAQIRVTTCMQLRVQLLKKLLKDKIGSEPIMQSFSLLSEGQYKSGLSKILSNPQLTQRYFEGIEKLIRNINTTNFDLFQPDQQINLREVSKEISFEKVKQFALSELRRLQEVETQDFDSISKPDHVIENEVQSRKVDELIATYKDIGSIDLNKDNFSYLIKEYLTCMNISMIAKKNDVSKISGYSIEQLQSRAYKEIGVIISSQKDSLDWLSSAEVRSDLVLKDHLTKFIRESCHLGDHRALNAVIEKLGDNFGILIKSVPRNRDPNYPDTISIEDIMKIIDKRIKRYQDQESQEQVEKWVRICENFKIALGESPRQQSVSALRPRGNTSLFQGFSISSESNDVAKSGPVGSVGAASASAAGLDGSRARRDGEAKR
jgi:hypothetical protein